MFLRHFIFFELRFALGFLLQWQMAATAYEPMSFKPVRDVNGSSYCAVDIPTAVFAVADVVGIPDGVPDAVRCAFVCSGFVNCTSYNHKYGVTSAVANSYDNGLNGVCELFTYIPRNCTTFVEDFSCIHYQIPRETSSCKLVCDPHCSSGGCTVQQDNRCDTHCKSGWALTANHTCGPCDLNCVGGCSVSGPGKCDSECGFGLKLSAQNNCNKWCPPNFVYLPSTDSCYYLQTSYTPYSYGASFCKSLNARLAFIETAQENTAVVDYLATLVNTTVRPNVMIGGCRTNAVPPDSFVWSTDCSQTGPSSLAVTSPFNYTNWEQPPQPDNFWYDSTQPGSGEWCAELYGSSSTWQWNDNSCNNGGMLLCEINSYVPPCDTLCVSGCSVQGPGKCDSQCDTGWFLSPYFTCKACPYGFTYLQAADSCYQLRRQDSLDNFGAAQLCSERSSHLAYIKSQSEQSSIKSYIISVIPDAATLPYGVWLGGCQLSSGSWVWSTNCSPSGPSTDAVTIPMSTYNFWYGGSPQSFINPGPFMGLLTGTSFDFSWFNVDCWYGGLGRAALCQTIANTSGCPMGFSSAGNKCYKLVTTTMSSSDASENCRNNITGSGFNAHLVYVDDIDEMTDLTTFLHTIPAGSCISSGTTVSVWSGGCRFAHSATSTGTQFVWSNQCSQQGVPSTAVTEPMNNSYANYWAVGEPDDSSFSATIPGSGQSCVAMRVIAIDDVQWSDEQCDTALCSVCELDRP